MAKGMMRCSWNIICYFLIFFLFLTLFSAFFVFAGETETVVTKTTGAAVSGFSATSSSETSQCSYETSSEPVYIQNQGTIPDTYTLALKPDSDKNNEYNKEWLQLSETSFRLASGEEKEVFVYGRLTREGTYSYSIQIESLYASTKELKKTITVSSCPNIAVEAYNTQQETCPCSTGVYIFELKNTGGFTETYNFQLLGVDDDYYVFSESEVTLATGDEKEIYVYVRMPCFIYGTFNFIFLAEAEKSGYTAELPLSLEVLQACYNYNIALGEALFFDANETLDISFSEAANTSYNFCQETPAVIPVQIKNPGNLKNTYLLAIEDEEQWITLAESMINLASGKEDITSIVVNTGAADTGLYSFALKANTLRGDLETVLPFTIEVQDCELEDIAWLKYLLSGILALILVAIIVAGFILVKGKTRKTAQQTVHKIAQWSAAEIFWQRYKKQLAAILLLLIVFLIISSVSYPIVKEKYAADKEAEKSILQKKEMIDTLFYNWATALMLLGVILLLFLVVWFLKSGKNVKDLLKWEKLRLILKWLWIILLVCLLLAGLVAGLYFLYINYKEDAGKFLPVTENVTNITEEESREDTQADIEADMQQELAEIQRQIAEKERQIAALDEGLMNLSEQAAQEEALSSEEEQAIEEKTALLQEDIAKLEDEVTRLQENEKGILDKLNLLDTKISDMENMISNIQEKIGTLEEQIAALQDMVRLSVEQINETIKEKIKKEITELEEEKQILEVEEQEIGTLTGLTLEEVPEILDDSFETILLFDVSLSTQIIEDGRSRFELALDAAKNYIQEKGRYSLMVVGKNAIIVRRKVDSFTALRTLDYLKPLDTQSNLGKALYQASDVLGAVEGRIILISDMETTDGSDIYKIERELEQNGQEVIFVNVAQQKLESTVSESIVSEIPEEISDEEQWPAFDIESQTAGAFFIEIPKNTDYTLNMDTYFSDEDNDTLQYSAKAGEHLFVDIKGNIATLTPEEDWIGETAIAFGADDGKGGKATSPAILVVVKEIGDIESSPIVSDNNTEIDSIDNNERRILSQYVPWIILGSILLLIIFSLVMGAFARKFHKEPQIPENIEKEIENREDKKKK